MVDNVSLAFTGALFSASLLLLVQKAVVFEWMLIQHVQHLRWLLFASFAAMHDATLTMDINYYHAYNYGLLRCAIE